MDEIAAAVDEIGRAWRAGTRRTDGVAGTSTRTTSSVSATPACCAPSCRCDHGGAWVSLTESARALCAIYRGLAGAESSVALVSAMHPAVLCYWLRAPDPGDPAWTSSATPCSPARVAGEAMGDDHVRARQRRRHHPDPGRRRPGRRRHRTARAHLSAQRRQALRQRIRHRRPHGHHRDPRRRDRPDHLRGRRRRRPLGRLRRPQADRRMGRHGHDRHAEPRDAPRGRSGHAAGPSRPARARHRWRPGR